MPGGGLKSASELGIGDGQAEVEVAAWTNTMKESGEKWLKLKFKVKEVQENEFSAGSDSDEDLPF